MLAVVMKCWAGYMDSLMLESGHEWDHRNAAASCQGEREKVPYGQNAQLGFADEFESVGRHGGDDAKADEGVPLATSHGSRGER